MAIWLHAERDHKNGAKTAEGINTTQDRWEAHTPPKQTDQPTQTHKQTMPHKQTNPENQTQNKKTNPIQTIQEEIGYNQVKFIFRDEAFVYANDLSSFKKLGKFHCLSNRGKAAWNLRGKNTSQSQGFSGIYFLRGQYLYETALLPESKAQAISHAIQIEQYIPHRILQF